MTDHDLDNTLPTATELQTLLDRANADLVDLQIAIDDAAKQLEIKFTPEAELAYSSLVARLAGAKLRHSTTTGRTSQCSGS